MALKATGWTSLPRERDRSKKRRHLDMCDSQIGLSSNTPPSDINKIGMKLPTMICCED